MTKVSVFRPIRVSPDAEWGDGLPLSGEELEEAALHGPLPERSGVKYSPDQPRDELGRFGSGGGTSSSRGELEPGTATNEDQRLLADIAAKTAALTQRAIDYEQRVWGYAPYSEASLSQLDDVRDMLAKNDNVRDVGDRVVAMMDSNPALNTWLSDEENQPFMRDDDDYSHESLWAKEVNGDLWGHDPEAVFAGLKMPSDPAKAAAYYWVAAAQYAWADSASADMSGAIQASADNVFGLRQAGGTTVDSDWVATPFTDALVEATYQRTQDGLRSAGITDAVQLYRGMKWGGVEPGAEEAPEWVDEIEKTGTITPDGRASMAVNVESNPLSSFSASEAVAHHFASDWDMSTMAEIRATVPVDRVFSTPFTGLGCLSEMEYIVLGGPGKVQATVSEI